MSNPESAVLAAIDQLERDGIDELVDWQLSESASARAERSWRAGRMWQLPPDPGGWWIPPPAPAAWAAYAAAHHDVVQEVAAAGGPPDLQRLQQAIERAAEALRALGI